MLRALVALLLIANAAVFGWSRGWLGGAGAARSEGAEAAARQTRQIRPQSVVILSPTSARAAAAALACLEAGPFNAAQLAAAESVLQPLLPPGSWTDVRTDRAPVWIVTPSRVRAFAIRAELRSWSRGRIRWLGTTSVTGTP